ncbi:MAG: FG-GAP repeat protein, partial [Micromonosporaceae bacterium]
MGVRVRKRWLIPVVLLGAAALAVPPVLAEDSTANCAQGKGWGHDLNADGVDDAVMGRPEESVDGESQAGAVAVLYGGGKGTRLITQNTPDLAGTAESGDQFGKAVVIADVNSDECPDLVASAPYEAVGTEQGAGAVWV